jgi:tetratricopeptide (TPR) repeat protein
MQHRQLQIATRALGSRQAAAGYTWHVLKLISRRLMAALASLIVLLPFSFLWAQANASHAADDKQPGGRVVLVLPFDNRSGNPSLNWIGDSFPDTLSQRLASAGYLPVTRDDRRYALDHLGLPLDFRPTRATTIRIAQTLDANYVIVGSFNVDQGKIQVQAQVLDTDRLRMSSPVTDTADLPKLLDAENGLAWKIARQIDSSFNVAEQTFVSASAGVDLSAFENYIRGADAATPAERIKRLELATQEAPNYAAADLALGKELYTDRDFGKAATILAKVPKTDRLALEASFYLGLARFNDARYADAESAFAFVASRLPLSEVVNDQGVAQARQGRDATALLQRAVLADPNDPDYRYNLAVSHYKHGDFAAAQREDDQSLKLRPSDPDATQLKQLIGARTAFDPNAGFQPTERLRRTYSEASFRQAATQLDQIRAMRLATLPPAQQSTEYTQLGHDYMAQGLLPEAEQEFNNAIHAYPASASGHAGLAEVREQSGDIDAARAEIRASLAIAPNVDAYLVLARLDLHKNDLPASARDVSDALRLDPKSFAALGMRSALQSRGQSIP